MDKRYQVFVSSTYTDLLDERRKVIHTLMEMDCIPAGMELFPAADEEQFEFIKRIIDDCDYYVLIIGGRYGSTTSEGVSYTEKEYDYAVDRGLNVLAFIHEKPDEIALGKSEKDEDLRQRLDAFRERVGAGRLVKFWSSSTDLAGLLATSLNKTIKMYPAIGWVRGDKVASNELLNELNELRKLNVELEKLVSEAARERPDIANIAGLDEAITINGSDSSGGQKRTWQVLVTWSDLFGKIAPYMISHAHEDTINGKLAEALYAPTNLNGQYARINDQDFQTVKIQMMALKLVNIQYLPTISKTMANYWELTSKGRELMMTLRSIKTSKKVN
jgi:Domain of unknown function (DUF4062)